MSKIANAYKMYLMLRGKKVVPLEEIAKALEVDKRMVKNYKRELIDAGISIETQLGRYGGYYLKNHGDLPIPLSFKEKSAIDLMMSFLQQHQFVHYDTVEKVVREYIRMGDINNDIYLLKYQHDTDEIIKKRQTYFPIIGMAIRNHQKLNIFYYSLSKKQTTWRIVWPLKLFEYQDTTYMAAYCESAEDLRFFKISRIKDIELDHSYFSSTKDIDIDDMLNASYGIFTGDPIEVDLIIRHPFSEIIKEKIIAQNQKIVEIDDTTIRFTAKMTGREEIESWILSMGENVDVIGGVQLKACIHEHIEAMYKKLNKEELV